MTLFAAAKLRRTDQHQFICGVMSWKGLRYEAVISVHDDVIKWKHFPRHWPFGRGIHRFPVNSPHKGQWREALMFSLICVWINGWVNNREAGDLRRYRAHYVVIVIYRNYIRICVTVFSLHETRLCPLAFISIEFGHDWLKYWFAACSLPSHYMNQFPTVLLGTNVCHTWIRLRKPFFQEHVLKMLFAKTWRGRNIEYAINHFRISEATLPNIALNTWKTYRQTSNISAPNSKT